MPETLPLGLSIMAPSYRNATCAAAWREGAGAHLAGRDLTSCALPPGAAAHGAWKRGWKAAEEWRESLRGNLP